MSKDKTFLLTLYSIPPLLLTPIKKNKDMKALTVYKASAGSGKTFTLAVEYIKLLIDNPQCFKNILAVTFTNKATEEMKLRILSQLYGIWKQLPESDTYTKTVCDSLGIGAEMASQRAGTALRNLVHNYNYFMVETIDSFFQSVLRNLARELDLTANLKIGLNDSQVEELAVDKIIDSLTSTSIILKWLINYIFSNIDEDKGWNVIWQVKSFGKTIFKDFYKNVGDELNAVVTQEKFFEAYTKELRGIKANAQKRMAEYAETFKRETENAGLTVMSYANKKSGIYSYFNKLKSNDFSDKCVNKTLTKCLDDASNWASKTSKERDTIIELVNSKLMKLLHDAEAERPKQWELYATADCTLEHLDKLRLLNSIENKVRELNNDANLFLLSNTQHLLHTLIKDSDSPFIFEKIGCRLEHIMIDEFQDTSSLQWQNFKVLLKECMSRSGEHAEAAPAVDGKRPNKSSLISNLIVGDVKQSIYRWRSGDWRLLNNINKQFDGSTGGIDVKTLQTNYRSERNIIDFNNSFFKIVTKLEYEDECNTNDEQTSQELLDAYADVEQMARSGREKEGLVKVSLLPGTGNEYKDNMLAWIDETIQDLLSCGVKEKDIAILVRTNDHIPEIADYIMERHQGLKIVSDEAFRLDASPTVCAIIQALRFINSPDNILAKATLAKIYSKTTQNAGDGIENFTGIGNSPETLDTMLPEGFVENIDEMVKKPLVEIIDYIYSTFKLDKIQGQGPYVCAFNDYLTEFVDNGTGGIDRFLEAWDDDICSKTIQSDEADGIRIISIHKSKGLEFDNVVIPFCSWKLESNKTMLWASPDKEPFNKLPIVPIKYTKKLLETIYAPDYRNEHIQNRVDNLNLLYVAFTRAGKNLFVAGRKDAAKKGRNNRSVVIEDCLPLLANELQPSVFSEGGDDTPTVFEYGKLSLRQETTDGNKTRNVFLTRAETLNIDIKTNKTKVEFKQSNDSRQFTNDETDSEQEKYIKTGNILHKLFSMINTADDIDQAVTRLEFDGMLGEGSLSADDIRSLLAKRLENKQAAAWFAPQWKVFTECSILTYDKSAGKTIVRQPDRVMTNGDETIVVDFKFGKPRNEYKTQIIQYMNLLENMNYKNVSGFIWYVYDNKVEEVKI